LQDRELMSSRRQHHDAPMTISVGAGPKLAPSLMILIGQSSSPGPPDAQPHLAAAQNGERETERHQVVEEPKEQETRDQVLGVELSLQQRRQHGGIEHS